MTTAAFITNAAMAIFEENEQKLKTLCNVRDPFFLSQKLKTLASCFSKQDGSYSIISTFEGLAQGLQDSWNQVLHLKEIGTSRSFSNSRSFVSMPSYLKRRQDSRSEAEKLDCLAVFLHDVGQHIQCGHQCSSILRVGLPMYAEVGFSLTHNDGDENSLRCSFGLQILYETCRDYFLKSKDRCKTSSCRLSALKFAQEAIPCISAVLANPTMPCRCHDTLAYHLEGLHQDFDLYLHSPGFDLYFQSPWVCGSQILEMHDALFYYGLRL